MNSLATNLRTRLGDNMPPSPMADDTGKELRERLLQEHAELLDRARDLEVGIGQLPNTVTPDNSARIQEFVAQVNSFAGTNGELPKAHKRAKQPFLDHGRIVDEVLLHRAQGLLRLLEPIRTKLDRYHKAIQDALRSKQEEQRLAAERARQEAEEEAARQRARAAMGVLAPGTRTDAKEALRRAEEAETRAAEAQKIIDAPDVRHTVRTDLGTTGYLRRELGFEVTNPLKIPWAELMAKYLRESDIQEILGKLVRAAVADGIKEIPGLRIFDNHRFQVKR